MNTQQQKQYNVLLVGDSCVDGYCYGSCDRLSPEAPVPVLKFSRAIEKDGMAANVRKNLENFGCKVTFKTNSESISKVRFIDERSGQQLLRVDDETTLNVWDGANKVNLGKFDAIVISDYNKGFVSYEVIETLRKRFKGPIFLDTKKQVLSRFNGIFVKINETEYNNRHDVNDSLIVTLGKRGAMVKLFDTEKFFETPSVEVIDVCGAGDTFLAALTYMFLKTQNIEESVVFANKAASVTVQHTGTYAPTLKEIV